MYICNFTIVLDLHGNVCEFAFVFNETSFRASSSLRFLITERNHDANKVANRMHVRISSLSRLLQRAAPHGALVGSGIL